MNEENLMNKRCPECYQAEEFRLLDCSCDVNLADTDMSFVNTRYSDETRTQCPKCEETFLFKETRIYRQAAKAIKLTDTGRAPANFHFLTNVDVARGGVEFARNLYLDYRGPDAYMILSYYPYKLGKPSVTALAVDWLTATEDAILWDSGGYAVSLRDETSEENKSAFLELQKTIKSKNEHN